MRRRWLSLSRDPRSQASTRPLSRSTSLCSRQAGDRGQQTRMCLGGRLVQELAKEFRLGWADSEAALSCCRQDMSECPLDLAATTFQTDA